MIMSHAQNSPQALIVRNVLKPLAPSGCFHKGVLFFFATLEICS